MHPLAPDKRHPKSDPLAQQEWKKILRNARRHHPRMCARPSHQIDVDRHIVMVMEGAGWHRSNNLKAPANLSLLKLPPYAPELNPIEHVWDELREKFFHNQVFKSLKALEDQLSMALRHLEENPKTVASIVSWPWIMDAL
jgi:transposase